MLFVHNLFQSYFTVPKSFWKTAEHGSEPLRFLKHIIIKHVNAINLDFLTPIQHVKSLLSTTNTLSLVSIWARFLCTMRMYPGGWFQASPSTCTGTPSSPMIEIFTLRHCQQINGMCSYIRDTRTISSIWSFFGHSKILRSYLTGVTSVKSWHHLLKCEQDSKKIL